MKTIFFRKSARALLHGTFQTQTMHVQYIFSSSNEKKCFAHGLNFRRVIRFVPPYSFLHYLIGESFLQKFDQICAVNILIVITKRTKAYFVLGVMFEKSPDLNSIFCENCKQCNWKLQFKLEKSWDSEHSCILVQTWEHCCIFWNQSYKFVKWL